MLRPFAETIPAVTVDVNPNGLPTANTQSPTLIASESTNFVNGKPFSLIFNKAISVLGSVPTNSAI